MSRIVAIIAVAMLVSAGCANLIAPAQSLACGGIHLLVRNESSTTVDVRINGTRFATVGADEHAELVQWFTPDLGEMTWPWKVEIAEPGTGSVLAAREVREDTHNGSTVIEVEDGASGALVVGEVRAGPEC
jgi:hypothetical protein